MRERLLGRMRLMAEAMNIECINALLEEFGREAKYGRDQR